MTNLVHRVISVRGARGRLTRRRALFRIIAVLTPFLFGSAFAAPARDAGTYDANRTVITGTATAARGDSAARISQMPRGRLAITSRETTPGADRLQSKPETPEAPPELSYQETQVARRAVDNGDQTFVMVDKARGLIILFEHGQAVFGGAALTGENDADNLPKDALTEKIARMNALRYKVTPAGRFTLSRGYEKDYGTLLDVNEIQGPDWGIAIHKVYLGTPSEHRDARLRSPAAEDKHITFGCINVAADTMRYLLRELPMKQTTPLYVLPRDAAMTMAWFTPRQS